MRTSAHRQYGAAFALALSLLTISLLVAILASCNGTPDPSISPLAFVSPIAAVAQYPYFDFVVPESTYGLTSTIVLEAELRTDGNIITETYRVQALLPAAGVTTDADGVSIVRWAVVDPGNEWLRATLYVTESERVSHALYGRMVVEYGRFARSDSRRFYWHRSVEPYTLRLPVVLVK